jgi:pimeloyl-ACP methyl ester carboxylesterase
MATFVLVHGAWHGGWCWRRVVPLLRASGHEVFTPTLTGLGERAHLLGAEVGLDTHVKDVLGVVEYEDLNEVVLVGHSYAGMIITSVAEVVPEKLSHLVYLDAWVPVVDGQGMFDIMAPERRDGYREAARVFGGVAVLPPLPLAVLGITDEEDARWVSSKLVLHPLKTFEDPVKLPSGSARRMPRTYIACTDNPVTVTVFRPFAERARTEANWRYRELPTGHDVMITMPRELSKLLSEVV